MSGWPWLRTPAATALLTRLTATDPTAPVTIDAPLPLPNACCATEGVVKTCDGQTDTWECWVCGTRWTAPCR